MIESPSPFATPRSQILESTAVLVPSSPVVTGSPALPLEVSGTPTTGPQLGARILSCDTVIDLPQGTGQVTNAYVRLTNSGSSDARGLCATLRGLHEGEANPDKTQCLPDLPAGYQVTFKLTIDSTADQSTAIQVEIKSGDSLLLRLGEPVCPLPGLIPERLQSLKTPQPIP